MQVLKEINYIFDKKQKIKIVILFIAIQISAGLELLGVTAVLPFINMMLNPESVIGKPFVKDIYDLFGFHRAESLLLLLAVAIVLIYVIKNAYLLLLGDLQFRFIYNNQRRLSFRIMETYMKQPYLFHTAHNTAELNRNVGGDTQVFYRAVLAGLQLVTDASVCVVLLVFLLITDRSITIGVSALFFFFLLFYILKYRRKMGWYGENTRKYSAEMTKWIYQAFGGIKEAQILNREMFFVNNYDKVYRRYADSQRKNNLLSIIPKPVVETLCIGGLLMIVSIKMYLGADMQYFIPVLTAFAVAAFKMLPSFNKITANLNIIMFSKPSIDAVYEDIIRVEGLQKHSRQKYTNKSDFTFHDKLSVEHLVFRYPEGTEKVLNDVSFVIPKNKSIAFIGPSGAGKTTLADILLGVLEPVDGRVLADNSVDIHQNLYAWHQKIGYIPQSIYLIDDTLRNNIAFGIPAGEISEEKIWNALASAQLREFVESLEQGLDTMVGEGGVRLSGGQRQRIGIARALYNNPELLVLDEATSALDNDTEKAVMEAIDGLSGSKTLIIIAHRLSTIQNCDLVYEVKEGKVSEIIDRRPESAYSPNR